MISQYYLILNMDAIDLFQVGFINFTVDVFP